MHESTTMAKVQRGFIAKSKVWCTFNRLSFSSRKVSDIFHAETLA